MTKVSMHVFFWFHTLYIPWSPLTWSEGWYRIDPEMNQCPFPPAIATLIWSPRQFGVSYWKVTGNWRWSDSVLVIGWESPKRGDDSDLMIESWSSLFFGLRIHDEEVCPSIWGLQNIWTGNALRAISFLTRGSSTHSHYLFFDSHRRILLDKFWTISSRNSFSSRQTVPIHSRQSLCHGVIYDRSCHIHFIPIAISLDLWCTVRIIGSWNEENNQLLHDRVAFPSGPNPRCEAPPRWDRFLAGYLFNLFTQNWFILNTSQEFDHHLSISE
jgi:hypothetical protein